MKGRLLGFDFGLKRIGVATGNTVTSTTEGLESVVAVKGTPQWPALDALLKLWRPEVLIIGLPLMMDGSEEKMAKAARQFAKLLEDRYQLPVTMVDERLSSSEADHLLRESASVTQGNRNKKSLGKKRMQSRDSLAAELILQTYLNNNL